MYQNTRRNELLVTHSYQKFKIQNLIYLPSVCFYNTGASGAEHLNNRNKYKVKNPNWQEADQLAILQAWPRSRTRVYRETTPASGQNETWTRDLRLSSPAL